MTTVGTTPAQAKEGRNSLILRVVIGAGYAYIDTCQYSGLKPKQGW
jgi:hypothetical protein